MTLAAPPHGLYGRSTHPPPSDLVRFAWQEPETCEGLGGTWVQEPVPHRPSTMRECVSKRLRMTRDPATGRPVIPDHEQPSHRLCLPAALSGEPSSQPSLSIKGHKGELHVGHDRLDFDKEQDARPRMERKHVDGAALSVHAERNFCRDRPAGGAQDPHDLFDDRRMVGVEEAVEALAVPREPARHPRSEGRGDPAAARGSAEEQVE